MALDIILMILGGIAMVVGIIGCILPVLPGPSISFVGLILLQLTSKHPFSVTFFIVFGVLTVLAAVLDYVVPIYGTKKFQGSKYGIWGSVIGLFFGIFIFPPFGLIIGPFFGAFIGEYFNAKKVDKAIKPAFGSFLGFLTGTAIKLALSIIMAYYYVAAII